MAKQKQISNAKPRVDKTRKVRADRRQAFLDAVARRFGCLDWGSFTQWARECAEEPDSDQGVNERLLTMLTSIAASIQKGDPNARPADMDRVRELYPIGGKSIKDMPDEAGRLAARPKPDEALSTLTTQRDSQERGSAHLDFDGRD